MQLLAELVCELCEVLEVTDARFSHIRGNGKSVFCIWEVDAYTLDRTFRLIGGGIGLHRRVPVAEKNIKFVLLQRLVDHLDPEEVGFHLISKGLQNN